MKIRVDLEKFLEVNLQQLENHESIKKISILKSSESSELFYILKSVRE